MKNCLPQNNFSSFLSGAISADERDTFELHLADCADCRSNLALMFSETPENFTAPDLLKEKVKNLPAKESKANSATFFSLDWLKINRFQTGFAAMLIVCCGLFGVYVWQNQAPQNSDDVWRNGSGNKNSVQLLTPENEAKISAEKIEFRWSEMPNAKSYTLVLSVKKGDIIKEISTEKPQVETTVSALSLTKETHYFWHVRIKFTDGLTAESATRKIFIR